MPPRPFHRWKTFWLGVLVLAFLSWAWARSTVIVESVWWKPGHRGILIGQWPGRVEFLTGPMLPSCSRSQPGWEVLIRPMPGGGSGFDYFRVARPAWITGDGFPATVKWATEGDDILISFSHWFLILAFLVPWTSLLLWRSRRMKLEGKMANHGTHGK